MDKKTYITPVAFTALAISSIFTTSNLSTLATNGGQLILLLFITTFLFFIPLAGVVGELSTSEKWGTNVFSWIENAFGDKIGISAVFWEWFQAIIMSIPMLYFVVGNLSYTISFQELDSNPLYRALACIGFYLLLVFLQLIKPELLIKVQAFGFWFCVMLPISTTFLLATIYILKGNQLPFPLDRDSFSIPINLKSLLLLVPFVLSLTGIEASGPFIDGLKDIKKDFPKAILVVIITIVFTNLIGSGAIAMIFPANKINLSRGLIESLDFLFIYFNIPLFLVKFMGLLMVLGLLPKVSNWIISPALALQKSSESGLLPKVFSYKNSVNTPTYILIFQSVLFIFTALLLSLTKSGNTAFLIAVYLNVAIYSCVYILIFSSYLKLITTDKNTKRIFEIPKHLKFLTGTFGLISILIVLVVSFFPPVSIPLDEHFLYLAILISCFIVTIVTPFLFQYFFNIREEKIK
ncbi:amino acid permease [Cetobacterium sp. 8H]|uniref:amino acid permease n=1 Tax=Cetobacterium sp. 8H TaxID=2759681 RepID=UPI00163BF2DD|nr:amino acid permease [Cetobacterium sp. 8H]MBC2851725.1 amino acid permease [Cetobacterium sp. 8H]